MLLLYLSISSKCRPCYGRRANTTSERRLLIRSGAYEAGTVRDRELNKRHLGTQEIRILMRQGHWSSYKTAIRSASSSSLSPHLCLDRPTRLSLSLSHDDIIRRAAQPQGRSWDVNEGCRCSTWKHVRRIHSTKPIMMYFKPMSFISPSAAETRRLNWSSLSTRESIV